MDVLTCRENYVLPPCERYPGRRSGDQGLVRGRTHLLERPRPDLGRTARRAGLRRSIRRAGHRPAIRVRGFVSWPARTGWPYRLPPSREWALGIRTARSDTSCTTRSGSLSTGPVKRGGRRRGRGTCRMPNGAPRDPKFIGPDAERPTVSRKPAVRRARTGATRDERAAFSRHRRSLLRPPRPCVPPPCSLREAPAPFFCLHRETPNQFPSTHTGLDSALSPPRAFRHRPAGCVLYGLQRRADRSRDGPSIRVSNCVHHCEPCRPQ